MNYTTIHDFVLAHTKPTKGKIKVVESGRERFLGGDKLEAYCSRLREMVDKKQIRLFVRDDGVYVVRR